MTAHGQSLAASRYLGGYGECSTTAKRTVNLNTRAALPNQRQLTAHRRGELTCPFSGVEVEFDFTGMPALPRGSWSKSDLRLGSFGQATYRHASGHHARGRIDQHFSQQYSDMSGMQWQCGLPLICVCHITLSPAQRPQCSAGTTLTCSLQPNNIDRVPIESH